MEQKLKIEAYKYDTPWQAKARKHQSDFRECEMKVPAVQNTKNGGCYGNVISEEDAAKGLNFYASFWDEIRADLKGKKGDILTNVLRSEHIPYNIFFPMRHDLKKAANLFKQITGMDIETVHDIVVEYAPAPKEEYLNDATSFDVYVDYSDSQGNRCGIGIEIKYTEQGYPIGISQEAKIKDTNSTYYRVTNKSHYFNYGEMSEEEFITGNFGKHKRGNELRQLWRNHILGLSMMQHEGGIKNFLSIHLYPSFNEHFNPKTSTVLKDYMSLLNEDGKKSFLPLTYEELFSTMKECGMDEIDKDWISYLTRRYILPQE